MVERHVAVIGYFVSEAAIFRRYGIARRQFVDLAVVLESVVVNPYAKISAIEGMRAKEALGR